MTSANRTGVTTLGMPSDREVVLARAFDAPRRLLFAAFTSPEHLPHWMLGPPGWTMTACEVDLRRQGAYHYAWRHPDGSEMTISGVYAEVAPPDRVVFTETWSGDWPETLNTLEFTESGGRTTVTTTMLFPSTEARDAALRSGMADGMSASYDRLDDHLRTAV